MAYCAFYYERRSKLEVCFFNFLSYSSVSPAFSVSPRPTLGVRKPLNNATAFGIVGADFNLHSVADCEVYVMNLKLPCRLGQYAMPAVQSDAKKVTAHRFGNGAKETGSRFLHYSPRMNFGTFVPTTVLTAVGAHSCPAAIAANIAWRNAPSALTACKRACIAATAAWSFGSSSRGRKSRYPAVMVTPWPSAFGKRRLRPAPHGIASLAADGDCHDRYMSRSPHSAISAHWSRGVPPTKLSELRGK